MFATTNATTQKCGQTSATIIADTVNGGHRITTFELVYPRYIHSELLTHRALSRNASSSRATPINVLVSEARTPVFFDYVGINKPGMQATETLPNYQLAEFKIEWAKLANYAADWVEEMAKRFNIHKQTLNRVLEPFTPIRTLVTATDWDNFFALRLKQDAQPEMFNLARAMACCMAANKPTEAVWHLPYITTPTDLATDHHISVARCARVSYARLDGRQDNVDDDIKLYERLRASGHMSPFEHVAVACPGRWANFNGWKSLRYMEEHKE